MIENDIHKPDILHDDPQGGSGGRMFTLKIGLSLLFLIIAARLVQIQIIERAEYRKAAKKQHEQRIVLPAKRGNIYDRNGNVFASNTLFVSYGADPKIIGKHAYVISAMFSRAFGKSTEYYVSKFRTALQDNDNCRFVWLERGTRPDASKRKELTSVDGVIAIDEPQRIYHYSDLAASSIGCTDVDNKGITGLEYELDTLLRGKDGFIVMQRDAIGRQRPSLDYPSVEPLNGSDAWLTLDLNIQSIVQEELRRGVRELKAEGGIALVVDPKTGELLAAGNVGGYAQDGIEDRRSRQRAVTDLFEPGSTFKLVTATAALEYKLIGADRIFAAENGKCSLPLPNHQFRLVVDDHPYDRLTFEEGMIFSSNIVMAKAGLIIGAEKFYRFARDYGFGTPTGIEIPGEIRGRLKRPHEWSLTSLPTMAFGYEVGVTPLQTVMAYAVVANGGNLMKPFMVSKISGGRLVVPLEGKQQSIRRLLTSETVQQLTRMFEGVVERGTGVKAKVHGIRIAGKTGTAKRAIDGQYIEKSYTASFIGYFPAEHPRYVCLVMLDNPEGLKYYGGLSSAPVFAAIARRIVGIPASFDYALLDSTGRRPAVNMVAVPDVRNLPSHEATERLKEEGLKMEKSGKGDYVIEQRPRAGTSVPSATTVRLVLGGINKSDAMKKQFSVVPDVRGMSVRRAMNRLTLERLGSRIDGSGIVIDQQPAAGKQVAPGSRVKLVCRSRSLAADTYE
jgi:cell division protein FtsI (penicillin-binding protein 3)